MARPLDARVDEALRSVGCAVTVDSRTGRGCRWHLAIANGAVMPVRASLSSGWLDLTAALPQASLRRVDDVSALRLNMNLPGSSRIARLFGDRQPHVRADVHVRHVEDLAGWVQTACSSFSDAAHRLADGREDEVDMSVVKEPSAADIEVERICRELGWPVSSDAGPGVRIELTTRVGAFSARVASSPDVPRAFVADLLDLEHQSATCLRAVAALLLAVSGSMRSVKGGIVRRAAGATAVLVSPLSAPLEQSAGEALSALAAAWQFTGREVQALLDERLAAEYLARSVGFDDRRAGESIHQQEEQTCLQ